MLFFIPAPNLNQNFPARSRFRDCLPINKLGSYTRFEMALQTEEPKIKPRCPKCESEDITVRCDAYANYKLLGFDAEGYTLLSTAADVQAFDDRIYICNSCNFEETKSDVFLHGGIVAALLRR